MDNALKADLKNLLIYADSASDLLFELAELLEAEAKIYRQSRMLTHANARAAAIKHVRMAAQQAWMREHNLAC